MKQQNKTNLNNLEEWMLVYSMIASTLSLLYIIYSISR